MQKAVSKKRILQNSWYKGKLQNSFGVPHEIEAAVHAGRAYLSSKDAENAMLKLDFRNAFNTLRRDEMLQAVLDKALSVFPLAHSAYSIHSFLYYGQRDVIISSEGLQESDPLIGSAPILSCNLRPGCSNSNRVYSFLS